YFQPWTMEAFTAAGCGAQTCDPLWTTDLQGAMFTPAVSGSTLVVPVNQEGYPSTEGYLQAVGAPSGAVLWTEWLDKIGYSAVTANGVAYVAASDQRLYAIRPSDGSVLWSSSQLGQPFEFTAADTPVIVNG